MQVIKETIDKIIHPVDTGSYPKVILPVSQKGSTPETLGVGIEKTMRPLPVFNQMEGPNGLEEYKANNKLAGKKAIITGGDSGIGRAVAVMYAMEGADVAIVYLPEEEDDANFTKEVINGYGRKCLKLPYDIRVKENCEKIVELTLKEFGEINILVNNASVMFMQTDIADITTVQFDKTIKTNIYGTFYMTRAVVPHLKKGDSIIQTTSQVAFEGTPYLMDYVMTKSAMLGMTRSLANQLAPKGIRVNAVAPGPVWTPMQEAGMTEKELAGWITKIPNIGRIGQPAELGPCFVYLASKDASFISGQTIHANGGTVLNA